MNFSNIIPIFLTSLFVSKCISSPLQECQIGRAALPHSTAHLNQQPDQLEALPRLILSIDGGGIRGILPAYLLCWLEEQLETELTRRNPRAPKPVVRLADCFDIMAGTSTGGIIVLGMNIPQHGRPKYPSRTFVELYQHKGAAIFPAESQSFLSGWLYSKYDSAVLEAIFQDYFQDVTLKDLPKPILITTYDVDQEELVVFNSLEAQSSIDKNYKLRHVARATSAAPTYFPASNIQDEAGKSSRTFIDGGVSANNPSLLGYLEAQKHYPHDRFHIISLGCGSAPLFTLGSKQAGGKLSWAGDISSLMMNSESTMNHQLISQMATLRGDQYTRLQFALDQSASALDNATPENINVLIGYAQREISNPHSPIHQIKQVLLDIYERHNYSIFYPLIQKIQQQMINQPQTLNLTHCFLTQRAFWEITNFLGHNTSIVSKLDLSHNTLQFALFAYLQSFHNLEELNLCSTNLDKQGLMLLQDIKFPKLKILHLQGNPHLEQITNEDVIRLLKPYPQVSLDEPLLLKLGHYYETKQDFKRATSYYQQGYATTNQLALIKILLLPKLFNQDQDIHDGFTRCQSLAQAGDPEAQSIMGHLYASYEKDVVEYLKHQDLIDQDEDSIEITQRKSIQQAAYWYHLAAYQNHKRAAYALAGFYYDNKIRAPIPEGTIKDHRHQLIEALKYYKIAQQAGSTSAARHIDKIEHERDTLLTDSEID